MKVHKCNQCDYASVWAWDLKKRKKSHSGGKNVQRQSMWLCFLFFASNFRRHMKTLSGEKSHKCNQCDFTSVQACDLKKHLKTHSGEKNHKCKQCDYASVQTADLRKHLKTHSGVKSYSCNQCDYAFIQESNFRRHLITHSRGKLHRCYHCDKTPHKLFGWTLPKATPVPASQHKQTNKHKLSLTSYLYTQ